MDEIGEVNAEEKKFSAKKPEFNDGFELSKSQWAQFYKKVGERKGGIVFPKAANGQTIMTIDNLLVYTDAEWNNPRISKVIETDITGISDEERSQYISFIQEDLIEYEKNGREISEDVQELESKDISYVYGGTVHIETHYSGAVAPGGRKSPGRAVRVYKKDNKVFGAGSNRAGDIGVSERKRSGDIGEKFSPKEPVEKYKDRD